MGVIQGYRGSYRVQGFQQVGVARCGASGEPLRLSYLRHVPHIQNCCHAAYHTAGSSKLVLIAGHGDVGAATRNSRLHQMWCRKRPSQHRRLHVRLQSRNCEPNQRCRYTLGAVIGVYICCSPCAFYGLGIGRDWVPWGLAPGRVED